MARLVAVHFCPVEKNAALTTFSTAELKSASASTMVGFLPPISSWMRRRRLEASPCSQLPIWQEPVKETALSGAALTSAWPSSPPEPATKLTTPFGMPASCSASTMRHALSGAADAGFSTTVLPQISAGASFHAGNRAREIPRRDQAHHADRLADGEHVDAVALGGHQHARHARAFAREIAQDVDGAAHFALGLGQRLAFLARHVGRDLVETSYPGCRRPCTGCCRAPARSSCDQPGKAAAAASAASAISAAVPLANMPDHFIGIRRIAIFEGGAGGDPLAVDVVSEHSDLHL